ncbi:MAG: oxidoreductase, partial [Planctomycetes bacterium]|nr:oxidoreductase [Planctomycetota bacterium]
IAVSFINGAVRTGEQEEWVKLLRRKSGLVVAFGSCAHLGGVPGLANFYDRASIFARVYDAVPSIDNPGKVHPQERSEVPEGILALPAFHNTVRPLDKVIDVDYYVPGCAPPPDLIMKAVQAILAGQLPPKGSVIAPDKALCDTCRLKDSKPEKMPIKEFKRVATSAPDPETCYLAQGFVCLGPATRSGCGERCINANMTCRGCFGPTPQALDLGLKALSALASIVDSKDPEEVSRIMDTLPDPTGVFYMYSLPSSILARRKVEAAHA